MIYLDLLRDQFNSHLATREKRPGVIQLLAPLFHEDGDMVDIFLEESPSQPGLIRVTDAGMTLMRLSYSYDVDTPNKEKILYRLVAEGRMNYDDGEIFADVRPESLYPAVLQFAQVVAKVSAMKAFKREVVQGLFYEMLSDFVLQDLARFSPESKVLPISSRDDLEVDYRFNLRGTHPVFLFAVKDAAKARLATISCLEFRQRKIPFRGFVVHENFDALPRKDRNRITSAADKQFVDFTDFKENAIRFLETEVA